MDIVKSSRVKLAQPKTGKMDLKETKESVLRWILSCETAYQLDLMINIMHEFIFERFKDDTPALEMELIKQELKEAWETQKVIVVKDGVLSSLYGKTNVEP